MTTTIPTIPQYIFCDWTGKGSIPQLHAGPFDTVVAATQYATRHHIDVHGKHYFISPLYDEE